MDLTNHRSRILTTEDIEGAHTIYGMSSHHVKCMEQMAPNAVKNGVRIKTLGENVSGQCTFSIGTHTVVTTD